jgi:DNA-binding NarL/FixJ family response regulator
LVESTAGNAEDGSSKSFFTAEEKGANTMGSITERGAARTAVVHDPHPLWINAVEAVLESIDVAIVGRAAEAERALALVEQHGPDLLICELQDAIGGIGGAKLIELARQRVPTLRVVVLAASPDPADIDTAFDAGALAYVLKTAHPSDVAATIRQTFDHSIFLATTHSKGHGQAARIESAVAKDEDVGLTRREREILALVSEGHSNKELAQMLWVTEQTVKFHLSNIYRKLDVSNRTEASRWAHQYAIVRPALELITA